MKNKITILTVWLCTMAFISNGWAQTITGPSTISPGSGGTVSYALSGADSPTNIQWTITNGTGSGTIQGSDDDLSVFVEADAGDCTNQTFTVSVGYDDDTMGLIGLFMEVTVIVPTTSFTVTQNSPTNVSSSSYTLNWAASSDASCAITSYKIIDSYSGVLVSGISPSATSANLSGLMPCSSYPVYVAAYVNSTKVKSSNTVTVTTTSTVVPTYTLSSALSATTNTIITASAAIYVLPGFSYAPTGANSVVLEVNSGSCGTITERSSSDSSIPLPEPDQPQPILTTNTERSLKNTMKMYPNPTGNGQFNVQISSKGISTIQITNLLGAAIYSNSFTGSTFTIQLPAIEPGTYLVSVTNPTNSWVQKLVVQ